MGLMAKPMLVTLPFVLLLLDYWPLNRLELKNSRQIYILAREKIPLLVLSAISCLITLAVQKSAGALASAKNLALYARVSNAAVSYIGYIIKMLWPAKLAIFYPHPDENLPGWLAFGAVVVLAGITVWIAKVADKHKYLLTGWLWYLGTLVPVIGLVQVGNQGMADRYTYIPSIGLFIIVAWGVNDLLGKWKYKHTVLGLSAFAALAILAMLTRFQVGFWRDSFSLFDRAIKVTKNNYIAHNNFALALCQSGKFDEAINHLKRSLQINPGHLDTSNHLAMVYIKMGRYPQAEEICLRTIKLDPTSKPAASLYNNLGVIYGATERYHQAVQAFQQAVQINPHFAEAHCGMGISLLQTGDKNSAIKEYEILKKLDTEKANILLELIHEYTDAK